MSPSASATCSAVRSWKAASSSVRSLVARRQRPPGLVGGEAGAGGAADAGQLDGAGGAGART